VYIITKETKPMAQSYYYWLASSKDNTQTWNKIYNYIYDDKKFPRKSKDWGEIRDYLEGINTPNDILDQYEESMDTYEDYLIEWEDQ
jgi:uncharacterized protein YozE (UPF0346 family)